MQVEIKKRLAKLHPTQLEIIDDSDLHRGHFGNNGGGHYTIKINSSILHDKSRIESHRLIYDLLGDLIPTKIHALQIKILK